jgi:ubiquitin-like 1-activating enzyme E1 A
MTELTQEQAAIYDRQIRVWGVDVQKRLASAKVLALGCTSLAAEVTKNFVLAGVGDLTLIDDTPAMKGPLTFLSSSSSNAAESAAEVFCRGLQELNPMVSVQTATGSSSELPPATLVETSHLVLSFGAHAGFQSELNCLCRNHNTMFMAASIRGGAAVCFADLMRHECKRLASDDAANNDKIVNIPYLPLKEAVAVAWKDLSRQDKRQMNHLLPPWTLIAQREIQLGRAVDMGDFAEVETLGKSMEAQQGLRKGLWDSEVLREWLLSDPVLPPVAAIVGGFMANDVVRSISHVGIPMHNVLFFNVSDNVAQIHNLTGSPSVL